MVNHAIARLKTYLAGERNHVVLAHGEHFNVLYDNQLIVTLVENSFVDEIFDVLLVAFSEEEHGLCVAVWSGEETFAVWVLSEAFEDGAHCASELLLALQCLFW